MIWLWGGCRVDSIFGKRGLGGEENWLAPPIRPDLVNDTTQTFRPIIPSFSNHTIGLNISGVYKNYCAEKILSNLWSPACCLKDIELCCWSWSTERLHRGHVTVMLKRQTTCIWYTCKFRPICSTGSHSSKRQKWCHPENAAQTWWPTAYQPKPSTCQSSESFWLTSNFGELKII